MNPGTDASHAELARVVRQHAGQLAASLMRVTGDFATAEDLVQDAVVAALQHWPVEGIPSDPTRGCSPSPAAAAWTPCGARATTVPSWRSCSGRSGPTPTSGCG
jgi:predicted RNA polymerase sigma factor